MTDSNGFGRRDLLRSAGALGGALSLPGCAASLATRGASTPIRPLLAPMRVSANELVDVKCCIRPFRALGCRLDAEQIGDTLVIHNYGHGGSGWSLSWGSGEIAVGKAMSVLPREIAVVGCGIVGLTSAILAQQAGLAVTIYAREMFARTRSVRAYGAWTPSSRIALTEPAGPAFATLWEQMARISWRYFRSRLGLPGQPVEFVDSYSLSDTPPASGERHDPSIRESYATTGMPQQSAEFAAYDSRIRDIVPQSVSLAPDDNPFGTAFARQRSMMNFNFSTYGHMLLSEFFAQGGKFENRDFHSPADIAALKEKVVINCPGYAARDLWRDKSIIPVRGQTGWLVPQPEAYYAFNYKGVSVLPKHEGVVVLRSDNELGDMEGVGNSMELPDPSAIQEGLALVAPLFKRMTGGRA